MPGFFDTVKENFDKLYNTKMLTNQRTPDQNKNLISNYSDHLKCLANNYLNHFALPEHLSDTERNKRFTTGIAKLYTVQNYRLRDRYDFLDDLLGASIVPLAGTLATIAALTITIIEGIHFLLISSGLMKGNAKEAYKITEFATIGALISTVVSTAIFCKSLLGLIVKPILTLFQGWEKQDQVRFINKDSVQNSITDEANNMLNELYNCL